MTRPDIKGDGGTVGRNRRSGHDNPLIILIMILIAADVVIYFLR